MEKVKLHKLCSMQSGGTPSRRKSEYYNGTIPWSKISDLEKSNDGNIYKTEEHITIEGLKSINNRLFKKGTLLLAMYGSVGKTAIAKIDLSTNQAILGINIKDESILDIKYLKFWFTTIKEQLLNRAVGAALQNISMGIVKDLEIPLPSLNTQQKIAAILDKADELRQYNKQLIAKYDALTQSLFLDMFGDPFKNNKKWEMNSFGHYITVLTDYHANGSYESLKEVVELKDERDFALMVRTTDLEKNNFDNDVKYITEEAYNYLTKSKVFGNEIIINKIGSAGNVYLMPALNRPVSLGMNAFLLRFNENQLNVLFTYFLLKTKYCESEIQKRVKGAVTKTIRKDAIREIPIIVPPIALQNQFAERVQLIETQKQQAQEALAKSELLFQGLLQQAFNGELN